MERELEVAAVASLGGWLKRKPKALAAVGAPCANCETALHGPYCHQCGQLAEDFHRSIGHLAEETVESLLHLDGRLWRTLPRLVTRPAELTRDYLEGHRAGQIPPLRLFLVVVLLFFLVGPLAGRSSIRLSSPSEVAAARAKAGSAPVAIPKGVAVSIDGLPKGMETWLDTRMTYARAHRHEFELIMEGWAHRLAVLLLPASALMLGLLFAFRRPRVYLYDHLVFSMHSLSFMGLLVSVKDLLGVLPAVGPFAALLLLGMPIHLFVHMRGVYRIGVWGTLVRMTLLFVLTCLVLIAGILLLVAVGLTAIPAEAAG